MQSSLLLWTLVTGVTSLIRNLPPPHRFPALLAARAALGLAQACIMPAMSAMAAKYAPVAALTTGAHCDLSDSMSLASFCWCIVKRSVLQAPTLSHAEAQMLAWAERESHKGRLQPSVRDLPDWPHCCMWWVSAVLAASPVTGCVAQVGA